MGRDLGLALEAFLDATRNWDLSRPYSSSLAKRTEGFTERWGDSTVDGECWRREQGAAVAVLCTTEYPQVPIRLVQYRPAWLEQLALRMAGLPHVVINSCYAVTEVTGPLPFIQDLSAEPPAMTGRMHLSTNMDSAILQYLETAHDLTLNKPLEDSPDLQFRARAYKSLICETLGPGLAYLQYHDNEAWLQINRPRCLQAGSHGGRHIFSAFQTRSERVHALSRLPPEFKSLSTQQVIDRARAVYQVFDHLLQQSQTILGTPSLTLVDVLRKLPACFEIYPTTKTHLLLAYYSLGPHYECTE